MNNGISGDNHDTDVANNEVVETQNADPIDDNNELAPVEAPAEGPEANGNVSTAAPRGVRFSTSDPEVSETQYIDGNYEDKYWHGHQAIHSFIGQMIVDGQAMQAVGAALAGGGANAAATAAAIANAADLCPNGLESFASPQVQQGLAQARAAVRAAVVEGQAQDANVHEIAMASMVRSASGRSRAQAIGYKHENTVDE